MAYVRSGLDAHVADFFDGRLNSSFVQRNPLLYFLGMRSAERKGKFGQPKTGAILGGADMGQAELADQLGSIGRQFSYQLSEPDDGASVEFGGATPTAAGFAEDNAGTTEFRYCQIEEPMKIRCHSLDAAKGESAIGSILDNSSGQVWNRFLKRVNNLLWNGGTNLNGSANDMNAALKQNAKLWSEPLGLRYAVGTQNNLLGRVDRSVETQLNPFVLTGGANGVPSIVDLDIIRIVNNGGTNHVGRLNMNPNGIGCQLFIVDPLLFNELKAQAEARGINIYPDGVPGHPMTGFRNQVIDHDGVYITLDKDCPAGTMYCLDLDSILMEVMPGYNFKWSGFTKKSETEEGGEDYEWGKYCVKFRMGWRCPWLSGVVTGLSAG